MSVSPPQLLRDYLLSISPLTSLAQGGVVVGPAGAEQQREGVVEIESAGRAGVELYAPLVRPRMQVRCIAATMDLAEQIGRAVMDLHDKVTRKVLPSGSETYLVHSLFVTAGPTDFRASDVAFGQLIYLSLLIGTQKVA